MIRHLFSLLFGRRGRRLGRSFKRGYRVGRALSGR